LRERYFLRKGSQGGRGRSIAPKYGASSSSTQHVAIGGDAKEVDGAFLEEEEAKEEEEK